MLLILKEEIDMVSEKRSPSLPRLRLPATDSRPEFNENQTNISHSSDPIHLPQAENRTMSSGFIKLQRTAEELFESDLDAFILLTHIAFCAKRKKSKYSKLLANQALVKGCGSANLTDRRYRDAKRRISENYQIATFKGTNKGTIATLINTEIYDINPDEKDEQEDEQRTSKGRATGGPLPSPLSPTPPISPSDSLKKARMKEACADDFAASPKIVFSFESRKFENIEPEDIVSWKEAYPAADIVPELRRMVEWCLSNEKKAKSKKLWRKFITSWLAKSNEAAINKQAFTKQLNSKFAPCSTGEAVNSANGKDWDARAIR